MKVKILNLDSRPNRWQQIQDECNRFGITNYERFSAYTGGYLGFNRSVYEMLRNESELLILEDDCLFEGNIEQVIQAKSILPDDWGLLYLGANVLSNQKHYKSNLWHCKDAWTSHAILYSNLAINYITNHFDPAGIIYDEWLRTVAQQKLKCFIMKPYLATQRPSRSDIWNTETDYDLKATEQRLI